MLNAAIHGVQVHMGHPSPPSVAVVVGLFSFGFEMRSWYHDEDCSCRVGARPGPVALLTLLLALLLARHQRRRLDVGHRAQQRLPQLGLLPRQRLHLGLQPALPRTQEHQAADRLLQLAGQVLGRQPETPSSPASPRATTRWRRPARARTSVSPAAARPPISRARSGPRARVGTSTPTSERVGSARTL